jgi:hypothetical protein
MLSEISKGRRVKLPSKIYLAGELLPYTLQGITQKYVCAAFGTVWNKTCSQIVTGTQVVGLKIKPPPGSYQHRAGQTSPSSLIKLVPQYMSVKQNKLIYIYSTVHI